MRSRAVWLLFVRTLSAAALLSVKFDFRKKVASRKLEVAALPIQG